ncbi:MAG: biopolymer transporter [Polyangiaceae bacterium]|nr:biopolymer transporter [Polyangiaceae bacterium]
MGGVDVGDGKGKRSTNADINMIPFIDLLMVTVAFLLITAVWVTNSRINANAQIPGPPDPTKEITPKTPEKVLNVNIEAEEFVLTWRQGSVVASEVKVPRPTQNQEKPSYPDLAKKFEEEWNTHGSHKNVDDQTVDQAVLHARDNMPFKEIVAVLDALYTPKREMKIDNDVAKVPVFNMTFSIR